MYNVWYILIFFIVQNYLTCWHVRLRGRVNNFCLALALKAATNFITAGPYWRGMALRSMRRSDSKYNIMEFPLEQNMPA